MFDGDTPAVSASFLKNLQAKARSQGYGHYFDTNDTDYTR